jgi:hypothetical protein
LKRYGAQKCVCELRFYGKRKRYGAQRNDVLKYDVLKYDVLKYELRMMSMQEEDNSD